MAAEREFSLVAERSHIRRRSPAILTDKRLTGEQIAGDRGQGYALFQEHAHDACQRCVGRRGVQAASDMLEYGTCDCRGKKVGTSTGRGWSHVEASRSYRGAWLAYEAFRKVSLGSSVNRDTKCFYEALHCTVSITFCALGKNSSKSTASASTAMVTLSPSTSSRTMKRTFSFS